jgi:hypothetical protein
LTDLADKMLAAAKAAELPLEHKIVIAAHEFEVAAKGFYGNPQTVDVKTFMGCWARARRAWSDYSGEPLF